MRSVTKNLQDAAATARLLTVGHILLQPRSSLHGIAGQFWYLKPERMKTSTPGSLAVPNSTPVSSRAALRAPIHNPYDKFSQGEFDAWIGDITGALKRALGQEPPLPQPPKTRAPLTDPSVFEEDDEVAEDSFAEINARRAAKGKQRAVHDEDEDEYEVEASILGGYREAEEEEPTQDTSYLQDEYDSRSEESSEDEEAVAPLTNNADDPIEILSSDEEAEEPPYTQEYSDEEPEELEDLEEHEDLDGYHGSYAEDEVEDEEEYEEGEDGGEASLQIGEEDDDQVEDSE